MASTQQRTTMIMNYTVVGLQDNIRKTVANAACVEILGMPGIQSQTKLVELMLRYYFMLYLSYLILHEEGMRKCKKPFYIYLWSYQGKILQVFSNALFLFQGITVRKYRQNSIIRIKVELTANHKGYFEFRLCPNNNAKKVVSQKCLDRHQLKQANGEGPRWALYLSYRI